MKYTAFFFLGLTILLTPYLGITTEWKFLITKLCGVIIVLGVIIRHYYIDSLSYENQAFDENTPEDFSENEGTGEETFLEEDIVNEELTEEDIELVSIDDADEESYSEEAKSELDDFLENEEEEVDEEDQRA